jgi:hypothetical protein
MAPQRLQFGIHEDPQHILEFVGQLLLRCFVSVRKVFWISSGFLCFSYAQYLMLRHQTSQKIIIVDLRTKRNQ